MACEKAANPEAEEEEQHCTQAEQGAARLERTEEEEYLHVNAEEKFLRPKAAYEEHLPVIAAEEEQASARSKPEEEQEERLHIQVEEATGSSKGEWRRGGSSPHSS